MAYSAPSTRSTSDLITASIWNSDVVANPIAIYAGAMSVTSQAVGDILYASSTTQLGRIAAVATGQVLTSAGTGTVPAWSSNVDLGGTLDVTGATTLDSTLGVVGAVTFNDAGADVDFRVESDDCTHMLIVDGANDRVGIGTTSGPASRFHVQGTDVMPMSLQRDTGTNGLGVGIQFLLGDSASATAAHSYGQVLVGIADNTNGGEDGNFYINLSDDGTLTENVRCIGASGNWKFCGNGHGLFGIGEVPFEATFSVQSTANATAASIVQTISGEYGLIIKGGGTSSAPVLDCRNSSGTQTFTVTDAGALSKASGSFRIPHPHPSKADTHDLVHSFVESNRAGLVYDGEVDLVAGSATIDMDELVGMTSGTWVLLTRDPHVFTSNETGWSPVRGIVSGATLTIECQDNTSTDTISYMVVAERQDDHMISPEVDWTDDEGRPIIEPLRAPSSSLSPSSSASPSE